MSNGWFSISMSVCVVDMTLSKSMHSLPIDGQQLLLHATGQRPTLGQPIEDADRQLNPHFETFLGLPTVRHDTGGRVHQHAHRQSVDEERAVPLDRTGKRQEIGETVGRLDQLFRVRV